MQKMLTPTGSPTETHAVLPIAAQHLLVARGGRRLLDDVSLTIGSEPAITVILGPNGAGKSVLLRTMVNLMEPDLGQVTWAGTVPSRRRQPRIGIVFQKPVLFERTVAANIAFALRAAGLPKDECEGRVAAALDQAQLAHLAHQPALTLSGGEQQRVALARTLATKPAILLLDEPCTNLDPVSTFAIEQRIIATRDTGTPVVMITHDLAQARRLAQRVVFMHRGRMLEDADAAAFFSGARTREANLFLKGEIVL